MRNIQLNVLKCKANHEMIKKQEKNSRSNQGQRSNVSKNSKS